MLPTKEEVISMLLDKMTNEDIAKVYDVSFQKIIQLIKEYDINPDKLRKIKNYIVYEHIYNGEVIYVGSGVWYRCRRHTNRRNSEHRALMVEGKIEYHIVAEFVYEQDARDYERKLIQRYKELGQAKFNKKLK